MHTIPCGHSQQCQFAAPLTHQRLLTKFPGQHAQLAADLKSQRVHRTRKSCITRAAEDGVEGLELGLVGPCDRLLCK